MRARPVLLLLALALPAPLRAQHAVAAGPTVSGDCDLCHAPHNRGAGRYTLRMGDATWFGYGGGEALGPASQSCLRCHGVAAVRRRQPEFALSPGLDDRESTYLGFDLADDHAVGRAGQVRATPSRVSGRDRPTRMRLTPRGALDIERRGLECTRCHDPHSRRGATPRPEDEAALCSGCHDVTGFQQGHQALPCSSCHRMHGGAPDVLLRSPDSDLVCRGCHDRAARFMPGSPATPTVALAPAAHARDPRPPTAPCTSCHGVHR